MERKRMDPLVKASWVAALRSGEYRQGAGYLKSRGAFCCLGVLCDLHANETGEAWGEPIFGGGSSYYSLAMGFPTPVIDWAGLSDDAQGGGPELVIAGLGRAAATHNDKGRTFAEIADAIEAQL